MAKKKQTIDEVIALFSDYLRSIHRADSTVHYYNRQWKKVKAFMLTHKIKYFDRSVSEMFFTSTLGKYEYRSLRYSGKNMVNLIEALHEFQETGKVLKGTQRNPPKIFTGVIGESMLEYITRRQALLNLSKATIHNYYLYLNRFLLHLNEKGIKKINEISKHDILSFTRSISPHLLASKSIALGILKGYLRHLFDQSLIESNYSIIVPRVNYDKQPKLPSVFSKEEVTTLLGSIDRSSPVGKRDYAILLLATKLGLRTSDIVALKFENIIWEKNIIEFNQVKTKKHITLPLLPEIGNAIIDYMKYGRPVSDEPYCFLQLLAPHDRIEKSSVGGLVRYNLKRAGIKIGNRKHGPHALRHSFAEKLLSNKTTLPVISEALGHSSSESTMYYMRIDINALRQCALEVDLIPSSFYQQKGGHK
ncbi:site-specific integrase [Longitalea arenae]|uniref:site-specific integrase n=1 Tax=Longitalea arenae TaxID=2812558 RepID=UPI00196846E8|nr:site-specific integrase [Longitalea arenae]